MNPEKQECHGLYLYGSGYFSEDDERTSKIVGHRVTFCQNCPRAKSCATAHDKLVRLHEPQMAEVFDQQTREGQRRGVSPATVALVRLKTGQPDPFYQRALGNFHRGAYDRRADDAKEGS